VHEMALMGGVFEVITSTLAQYEVKKVNLVKLKIGKLTNAEPEALQMAFEAYAKGTICEGAQLQIELVPVKARCKSCQAEFDVDELAFVCPVCEGLGVEIIQGEELLLESLEVEQ